MFTYRNPPFTESKFSTYSEKLLYLQSVKTTLQSRKKAFGHLF